MAKKTKSKEPEKTKLQELAEEIKGQIDDVLGDRSYPTREVLDFTDDIASHAESASDGLRDDLEAQGEDPY